MSIAHIPCDACNGMFSGVFAEAFEQATSIARLEQGVYSMHLYKSMKGKRIGDLFHIWVYAEWVLPHPEYYLLRSCYNQ